MPTLAGEGGGGTTVDKVVCAERGVEVWPNGVKLRLEITLTEVEISFSKGTPGEFMGIPSHLSKWIPTSKTMTFEHLIVPCTRLQTKMTNF